MFYIYAGNQQIYKPLDDLLVLFNPKLTLEIGKAGSLEFDIPPANPYYSSMSQLSTEITVDIDNEEVFHGRVLSNERRFNNIRHIYCEGDLSYLIDSVQKGVKYSGTTHALFRQIIANHNARMDASKRFTVGTIGIENRDIVLVGHSESDNLNTGTIDYEQIAIDSIVDNWSNSFDYIQTCLIDYCGGYLRTRRSGGVTYIDLLSNFGNTATQAIELGSNLLDLNEEISAQDVFTVLIPLGDDNLTIASVNGGSDELVDTANVARFGRIVKTHVFSNVTSASTLLENARRFLASNSNIPKTISVKAVDLHFLNPLINPIRIGDRVTINSDPHDVNDVLTCTQIEYDLEHPENNNYIFGNPQQSLTQRYREDVRLSNDTYGNSAGNYSSSSVSSVQPASVGSVASAAAAAAGATANQVQEKALSDFYDAWIDYDPGQATVSLGALSKQYFDGKEVLMSQCGIDLDGKTGNVNIQSLHNVVDEHGNQIAANEAHINILEDDTSVAIETITQRHDTLAGLEAEHYTAITQKSEKLKDSIDLVSKTLTDFEDTTTNAIANINMTTSDHESRISSTASYVSSIDNREDEHYGTTTSALAQIQQITNNHESRIESTASFVSTINGVVTEHTASITQLANGQQSLIEIKADKLEVNTAITNIQGLLTAETERVTSLMAGNTTATHLLANTITASSIQLKAGSGTNSVVSEVHSHRISTKENDDGTVSISIGSAVTNEIPQKASFNIADTKKYKDGVAAVKVESLAYYTLSGEQTVTYNASNKTLNASVQATLSNNNTNGSIRTVTIPATLAFDAGVASAEPTAPTLDTSWATSSTGYLYRSGTNQYEVRVKSNSANGKSLSGSVYVSASAAYDAGQTAGTNSVNAAAPTLDTSWATSSTGYLYRSGTKQYEVRVKSNTSTGKSLSGSVYVSASAAFDAGKTEGNTAGIASVNIRSIALDTSWSVSSNGYNYETANKRYAVRAKAIATNDHYSSTTLYVPASDAFNAGKTEGTNSVNAAAPTLDTSWATSSTGYLYRSGTKQYEVRVKSNTSTGKSLSGSVTISASAAWNAGYDNGYDTGEAAVRCTSLGGDPDDSPWESRGTTSAYIYIPIKATLTNGKDKTNTISYNATSICSYYYDLGAASGGGGGGGGGHVINYQRGYDNGNRRYWLYVTCGDAGAYFYSSSNIAP